MLVWLRAREVAKQVRESYGLSSPVMLNELSQKLGINVWVGDLKGPSGLIVKKEGEDPNIYLERSDSKLRQRFTLAHELGHYFERLDARDESYSFRDKATMSEARSSAYGLMEFYADEFAGEILMPEAEFMPIWDKGGEAAAAAYFKVSPAAAKKRHQRIRQAHKYLPYLSTEERARFEALVDRGSADE